MFSFRRIGHPMFLLSAIALLVCVSRAALCQSAPTLRIPDGQTLLMTAQAEGVQIYIGKAKPDSPGAFAWTLEAPRADLFDNAHKQIGTHSIGPEWAITDGSKVVGVQPPKQRVNGASPGDIPWLLLEAKSHEGTGMLSQVTYIMRVNTSGGAAPSDPPTKEGEETEVKYQATYVFLAAAPPG